MTEEQLTEIARKLQEALALMPPPTELLTHPHGRALLIARRHLSDSQLKVLRIRDVDMKKKSGR